MYGASSRHMHLTTQDSLSCYSAHALLQLTGFGEGYPALEGVASFSFLQP